MRKWGEQETAAGDEQHGEVTVSEACLWAGGMDLQDGRGHGVDCCWASGRLDSYTQDTEA